jgi:5-methylcytosine-specific restriction endonuclease McrA
MWCGRLAARRADLNGDLLGETTDLREFLFGAERSALAAARPVLMDLQRGKCFYCAKPIRSEGAEVDHFIPWAKYPADLAHNLVLADRGCNGKKRDRITRVSAHLKTYFSGHQPASLLARCGA